MGFETEVTNEGRGRLYDGFGGYWERGCLSESIVLETTLSPGVATESVGELLPADSIIEGVTARVSSTLVGATEWSVGDAVSSTRFTDTNSTIAAGTTVVGLNHLSPEEGSPPVGGPKQVVAGKVLITTLTTPSAGVVRVSVYYSRFVAPTS